MNYLYAILGQYIASIEKNEKFRLVKKIIKKPNHCTRMFFVSATPWEKNTRTRNK